MILIKETGREFAHMCKDGWVRRRESLPFRGTFRVYRDECTLA
jgi:hypothetical protein